MSTLPEDLTTASAGHVGDHNEIHALLNVGRPDRLHNGSTTREAFARHLITANFTVLTSGVGCFVGIGLYAGDVVTSLSFLSGTTALTMGSNVDGHLWFALYSPTVTLLSQSADQGGSVTWTAATVKTLALGAPQTITTTGWYYAAVMVAIGTGGSPAVPSMRGVGNSLVAATDSAGWPSGAKKLVGSGSSALGATAPAGPVTLTTLASVPYAMAS